MYSHRDLLAPRIALRCLHLYLLSLYSMTKSGLKMKFRFNGHYLRIPCHQSRVTPLRFTAFFFSHDHSGILGDGVLMKILLCTFLLFSSLKLILPAADSFASSIISYRRRMYFVSPYSNRRLYCSLRLPDAF